MINRLSKGIIAFTLIIMYITFVSYTSDGESFNYDLKKNIKMRKDFGLSHDHSSMKTITSDKKNYNPEFGGYITKEESDEIDKLNELGAEINEQINNSFSNDEIASINIDNEKKKINIGLINMKDKSKIISKMKQEYKKNINFEKRSNSIKKLTNLKKSFDQQFIKNNLKIDYTYISDEKNKIIVGVEKGNIRLMEDMKQKYSNKYFEFEFSESFSQPSYRQKNEFGIPIMAGQIIGTPDSSCTNAFMIKKVNSYYLLTAGHCTSYGEEIRIGNQIIGKTSMSRFKTGYLSDSAAISIPSNYASGLLWGTTNSIQNIFTDIEDDTTQEIIGQKVCKTGMTTGMTCGVLLNKNYSTRYVTNGVETILTGMRLASYEVNKGDSGGPVYYSLGSNKRKILGINSGMTIVSGTPSNGIYSHIVNISEDLGIKPSDVILEK